MKKNILERGNKSQKQETEMILHDTHVLQETLPALQAGIKCPFFMLF